VGQLERLKQVAERYELAGGAVSKLRILASYDIVVLADDSGSMANLAHEPNANDPFAAVPTRWQELCERVVQIVEIATCLDEDGIDIYFLNRAPVFNVKDVGHAASLFAGVPAGYTPLSAVYRRILNEKVRGSEKKVLIIIATDGEPNVQYGANWVSDTNGFFQLLSSRDGLDPARCPTTIMACTDNDAEIRWLNQIDDQVPHVDVVDDYISERKEVTKVQGRDFPFSRGDYVVKTLLGAIFDIYDGLDESKLLPEQYVEYFGCQPPPGYSAGGSVCGGCEIL